MTREGRSPFTRRQLIDCVRKKHPDRGESSLNPMIQGMTVNLKGGAPGGIDKDVFYSVGRGLFELYDSKKHDRISNIPLTVKTEEKANESAIHEKIKEATVLSQYTLQPLGMN